MGNALTQDAFGQPLDLLTNFCYPSRKNKLKLKNIYPWQGKMKNIYPWKEKWRIFTPQKKYEEYLTLKLK
jgi:hypothetical protein